MTTRDETVAAYWDHKTNDVFDGPTYWLANPLVAQRHQQLATRGQNTHWVNHCVERHLGPARPVERILTVGCGDGDLERHLALLDAAVRIEGIDIAPRRVEIATRRAAEAGLGDRLHYRVADAEALELEEEAYDAIFFDSSLHHLENLEQALESCSRGLKRDGSLFVNENVGPHRFDLTPGERRVIEATFSLIPARYRRSHAEFDRGKVRQRVAFPDPAEVARVDPSESIRSSDIPRVLEERFELIEVNSAGGTILQFLLDGIAGNFVADDPASVEILEMIFAIEERMLSSGHLRPHFLLAVCAPR